MTIAAPVAASAVLDVARSQIGVHESPANSNRTPYSEWYGLIGPWCGMFVSWCLHHAGFPLAISSSKGFAYTPAGADYFKQHGAWLPAHRAAEAPPGSLVFFDFIGRISHTGLKEGMLADGRVATIEGNTNAAGSRTGGSVLRHNRSVSGGMVGFGVITYAGGATRSTEDDMRFISVPDYPSGGRVFILYGDGKYRWVRGDEFYAQCVKEFGEPNPMINGVFQGVQRGEV